MTQKSLKNTVWPRKGMIADAVLYGFSSCPFFLHGTPHIEKMISFLTTLSLFSYGKKTQRKENIHICLCFKDLAL